MQQRNAAAQAKGTSVRHKCSGAIVRHKHKAQVQQRKCRATSVWHKSSGVSIRHKCSSPSAGAQGRKAEGSNFCISVGQRATSATTSSMPKQVQQHECEAESNKSCLSVGQMWDKERQVPLQEACPACQGLQSERPPGLNLTNQTSMPSLPWPARSKKCTGASVRQRASPRKVCGWCALDNSVVQPARHPKKKLMTFCAGPTGQSHMASGKPEQIDVIYQIGVERAQGRKGGGGTIASLRTVREQQQHTLVPVAAHFASVHVCARVHVGVCACTWT
eukprot:1157826-Pelagomonas_calceolata.AAC.7